jgi:hypothetical protein
LVDHLSQLLARLGQQPAAMRAQQPPGLLADHSEATQTQQVDFGGRTLGQVMAPMFGGQYTPPTKSYEGLGLMGAPQGVQHSESGQGANPPPQGNATGMRDLISRLQAQGGGTPQQIGAQYGWTPAQIQQTGLLGDAPAQVSVFDAQAYLRNNPDLQQAWSAGNPWGRSFASPEAWAKTHYDEAGKREGRAYPTMMADPAQTAQPNLPPTPPVQPYTGDFNTYGQGPEHSWFGGLNGQPYGLTSFTGYKPQPFGGSQFQQLMDAINAMRSNPYAQNLLASFGGGGVGDPGGSGHGDGTGGMGVGGDAGMGGANGDAGIGGDGGTGVG